MHSNVIILARMGEFFLKAIFVISASMLVSCAEGPVEYATENPGGYLHEISTDPADVFHRKVSHEADLEARGIQPPVGNTSWHDYWTKMIAYWSGPEGVGTHREVVAYIVEQRRARGLHSL